MDTVFDALTVTGAGEPFTLGTFMGTAPTTVNNVLTPGAGPNGTVGYEEDFTLSAAFMFYAFGASTVAINSGNADQEFSGIAALPSTVGAPEPSTWLLLTTGLVGLLLGYRYRQGKHTASSMYKSVSK
jgi:hypothetical protein